MDFLLRDKGDGGEFSLEGGDLKQDGTFFTAVDLSLFNGDAFYNVYSEYKTDKKFEELLSLPVTSKNLKDVEQAAKNALDWLIDEKIANKISVFASGDISEKINVEITITEPDGQTSKFSIVWQNEKHVLREV